MEKLALTFGLFLPVLYGAPAWNGGWQNTNQNGNTQATWSQPAGGQQWQSTPQVTPNQNAWQSQNQQASSQQWQQPSQPSAPSNNVWNAAWQKPSTTETKPPKQEVKVEEGCVDGQVKNVNTNTDQFEICVNDKWLRKNCAPGTEFSMDVMMCVRPEQESQPKTQTPRQTKNSKTGNGQWQAQQQPQQQSPPQQQQQKQQQQQQQQQQSNGNAQPGKWQATVSQTPPQNSQWQQTGNQWQNPGQNSNQWQQSTNQWSTDGQQQQWQAQPVTANQWQQQQQQQQQQKQQQQQQQPANTNQWQSTPDASGSYNQQNGQAQANNQWNSQNNNQLSNQNGGNQWNSQSNNQWQNQNNQGAWQTAPSTPQWQTSAPTTNTQWQQNTAGQWQTSNGGSGQSPSWQGGQVMWQPANAWQQNPWVKMPQPSMPSPTMPTQPSTPEPTPAPTVPATAPATTTTTTTTVKPSPMKPMKKTMKNRRPHPMVYFPPNKCKSGTRRSVEQNIDAFEVCDNGEWVFMLCAPGTWFDTEFMECTDGYNLAPSWPVSDEMMMALANEMSEEMPTDGQPASPAANPEMMMSYANPNVQQQGNMPTKGMQMPAQMQGMPQMQTQMQGMPEMAAQMMAMMQAQAPEEEQPTSYQDPNLWVDDVREVIVVSVEKCKVGRTREDEDVGKYQECIMSPAGQTLWIRRNCAPGALFSPWTKNCGKYNVWYNDTNPWLTDDAEETPTEGEDEPQNTGEDEQMMMMSYSSDDDSNSMNGNGEEYMYFENNMNPNGEGMMDMNMNSDNQMPEMKDNMMAPQTNDFKPWIKANDKKLTITLELDKYGKRK